MAPVLRVTAIAGVFAAWRLRLVDAELELHADSGRHPNVSLTIESDTAWR